MAVRVEGEALKRLDLLAWLAVSLQRREDWSLEKAIGEVLGSESSGEVLGGGLAPGEGEILLSWRICLFQLREME